MSKEQKKTSINQKEIDQMVKQATTLGLGLAIISKEALEKTIKRVSKKQDVTEREAKSAVSNLVAESKKKEKQLEDKVRAAVNKVKEKSPIITKKEAEKLRKEILGLKAKLKKK
ncbi:MAG: hypothetical protein WCW13_06305 [archaeon]|jgi:polyhydroxyalkanoate synthesis regulator phasin